MKKFIVCMIAVLLLTGCGSKFSYDDELNLLLENFSNTQSSFKQDSLQVKLEGRSHSFKQLIGYLYSATTIDLGSTNGSVIALKITVLDKDNVIELAMQDTTGFVSDVKNLYTIGLAQDEINNYVYDYLYVTAQKYYKCGSEVQLELEQCAEAPFVFITNEPIVDTIVNSVDTIVADLCQQVQSYELLTDEDIETPVEIKKIELNKIYTINYCDTTTTQPFTITMKDVLRGSKANEKLLELSTNNESILHDNLCYVEYEVHNYGQSDVIFSSKFYDADSTKNELFVDSLSYFGIPDSYLIQAGSTTLVMDVIAINHGDLVWYDEMAQELYLLNQE